MTQAFDDYAASRPQYAATRPVEEFALALEIDRKAEKSPFDGRYPAIRDAWLFHLAVRALRNQGQPYYTQQEVKPGDND